ncbi:MAG: hypothetical protein ACJAUV_001203 [Flavobacteriales bacterium]|jgi:hypothetical protein
MKQFLTILILLILNPFCLNAQIKSDFPIGKWNVKKVESKTSVQKYVPFFNSFSLDMKEDNSVIISITNDSKINDENTEKLIKQLRKCKWAKYNIDNTWIYVIYSNSAKSIAYIHMINPMELTLGFSYSSPKAFLEYEITMEK